MGSTLTPSGWVVEQDVVDERKEVPRLTGAQIDALNARIAAGSNEFPTATTIIRSDDEVIFVKQGSGVDARFVDLGGLLVGVAPIYSVKDFRRAGGTDSEIINRALRKIETDAQPGSRLIFEMGRQYTYDSSHSLGYINDLEIDLNGAVLKRAAAATTNTTLAVDLDATGVPGRTMVLSTVPANWNVGDLVAAITGNTDALASSVRRITGINRGTKTVTLNSHLDRSGVVTWPAGTAIAKSFNCFVGRPSVADSSSLLTPGANKRVRIHGGTIDGNEAQQVSNSWRIGTEILLHSEGGAIYDMKFQNTAGECIVGHGISVSGSIFIDLGGSALHTSVNDFLVDVATPTIFMANVVRRVNLKGQAASGHAEGAVTFSWGPGHLMVLSNLFEFGSEALFGNFGTSTGPNPSRLFVATGNICKSFSKIFAAVNGATYGVTLTGNAFHDCGDNTSLTNTFYNRLNRIGDNSISGNTILPEQPSLVAQRFGPVVIETIGGAGPAIVTNTLNRLWVKQTGSGVPAANLADSNVVLEAGDNNILTFAGITTTAKYQGIQWRVAGVTNPVAYAIHVPSDNTVKLGISSSGGHLMLKSGNFTDHLKCDGNGDTVFINRARQVYFGDPSTDGSWMLDASTTDFIFRRRVSGSWVVKQTIAG